MTTSLLKRKDIAARLGLTANTLRANYETRADFPKPAIRASQKTVLWDAADIDRWIKRLTSAK